MWKIAILYHSVVGNTKKVAEKIDDDLSKIFDTEIFSIEKLPVDFSVKNFFSVISC